MINESVFKAYDIRGVYPAEIDADFAYKLGRALVLLISKENPNKKLTIGVGRDMRLSSPELTEKLIAGILDQGADVADLGLVSTPSFYFGVANYDYDAGIQVSASHNPAQYNGFKMVRAKAVPISGDTGIMELKDLMLADVFPEPESLGEKKDNNAVLQDHVEFALRAADTEEIKPLKVVLDTANAMGGPMFEKMFKALPCELIHINAELDGTFPAHEADPLKDENNRQLQKKVIEEQADLGIVLDGDADRIFFIDDSGKTIEPAIVRGILSMIFLRENPGAKICYDIRPGRITRDMIEENGGEPIVTKVGHSLIKEKAREAGAVFAGESSGHFFLKTKLGIFELPMIMALKLLVEFSKAGKKVSEYIKPLQKYNHSGEINFAVEDKNAVFERLKEKYATNLVYDFDGVTFEWPDWWFNVRASNTENKVRLNLEAIDPEIMERKKSEVMEVINS